MGADGSPLSFRMTADTPLSGKALALRQCTVESWQRNRRWLWYDVAAPLLLTRLALLLTGWFSQYLAPSVDYPLSAVVVRGWQFSPHRLLDIWGRWDSGWYMNIVEHGYQLSGDVQSVQSNIAFFPLYPFLVRVLALPLPAAWRTRGAVLFVGVVLSNLFLAAALVLLFKLVYDMFGDQGVARRSVLYLLLFPTGFFFSCFYTESAFLFLGVATFYLVTKRRWLPAAASGFLLSLARPQGALILVPVLWIYLESVRWNWRKLDLRGASLLLIPAGLLTYLLAIASFTGDVLAPIRVQQAWNKQLAPPWSTILAPAPYTPFITPLEQFLTAGFFVGGLASLVLLPSAGYGLYALLSMAPILVSGTLVSSARYYAVLFPIFIVLARAGRHPAIDRVIMGISFTLQLFLMAAWSQFYWVA